MEIHTLSFEHVNVEVVVADNGEVQIAFREPGKEDDPVLLSADEFAQAAEFVARHAQIPVGA